MLHEKKVFHNFAEADRDRGNPNLRLRPDSEMSVWGQVNQHWVAVERGETCLARGEQGPRYG